MNNTTLKRRTLSVLVENTAGVLSQVSRLFSRKGYNIDSLAVGTTDDPEVSRITIEVTTDDLMIEQIINQLRKLFVVYSVRLLPPDSSIRRELVLIKVKAEERNVRDEVIQISNLFRANIIDVSRETLTVAIFGEKSKTTALIGMLEDFGILEIAKTGTIAIERGRSTIYDDNKLKEEYNYGKNVL